MPVRTLPLSHYVTFTKRRLIVNGQRTMSLPFHKSQDLKLIKMVKNNPVLYNPNHEKYLLTDRRDEVWKTIGEALERPAHVCKARWINIRDNMRRNLRERTNKSTFHKYKYENEVSFLLPFFKMFASQQSSEDMPTENSGNSNSNDEMPTGDHTEEVKPDISSLIVVNRCDEETFTNTTDTRECNVNSHSVPKEVQNPQPTDPINVFLEAIGSTLRKLSPYYLNQAKSKIFQVAQDYELQEIVNNEERPSTSESGRT